MLPLTMLPSSQDSQDDDGWGLLSIIQKNRRIISKLTRFVNDQEEKSNENDWARSLCFTASVVSAFIFIVYVRPIAMEDTQHLHANDMVSIWVTTRAGRNAA